MDSGSSCKVFYEHYFLKLNSSIRALRVDSKIPLVGFSSNILGLLEKFPWKLQYEKILTQGPSTLGIVRSDSPHNLLLGEGLAIAKMGIIKEGEKKIKETILEAKKDVTHKSMPEEKS
ncbi:hypothetical protein Tco_0179037 [Tanacetum coccineum]